MKWLLVLALSALTACDSGGDEEDPDTGGMGGAGGEGAAGGGAGGGDGRTCPSGTPAELASEVNPVEGDADAIAAGAARYAGSCAVCHGNSGESTPTSPTIFFNVDQSDRCDGYLFSRIRDGVPGTIMVAWGENFSDQEIWELISHIRTFQP